MKKAPINSDIKNSIKSRIKSLSRHQVAYFSWLCAVRALPFLCVGDLSDIWGMDSFIHLFSVFDAIDRSLLCYTGMINMNNFNTVMRINYNAVTTAARATANTAADTARAAPEPPTTPPPPI